jgi:hypothetical protein
MKIMLCCKKDQNHIKTMSKTSYYQNKIRKNYFEESNNKLPTPIPPTEPLEVILRDCGELCNTSRDGSPGPYFNHVTAEVNCPALFKKRFHRQGSWTSARSNGHTETFNERFYNERPTKGLL